MSSGKPVLKRCTDTIDMAPLYEAVMNRTKINGKNVSVHINIYERLPVDKRLIHGKCSNLFDDYEIILLEKDSPSSMLKQVSAAMERRYLIQLPQVNLSFSDSNLKQDQSTRSKINGAYIYLLQKTLLDVCKILRLNNCPQIWFFPDYFSAGTSETDDDNNAISLILNPNYNALFMLLHEIRHVWQKKYHPEVLDNYIDLETCWEKFGRKNTYYGSQIAEFDADAFAHAYYRLLVPSYRLQQLEFSPLNSGLKKAVKYYFSTSKQGMPDFDRLIDYKSLYPGLIL